MMENIDIEMAAGFTIYASTGMLGRNEADRMSTMNFYKALKGTAIKLLDKHYLFNIATYNTQFDENYMHTYSYAPDEAWLTYNGDLNKDTYRQEDYVFSDDVYFRICLKRVDDKSFTTIEEENIDKIIQCCWVNNRSENNIFIDEVEKTVRKINDIRKKSDLVLAVLTDTHCTINGTWSDTIANISAVNKKTKFDAIIHLGDLTDGMVPKKQTKYYAENIINDLKKMGKPVHVVLGNHDSNYFMNNPEILGIEEQIEIYQKQIEEYKSDKKLPYYYIDYNDKKIRCVFLSAYDNQENLRYGFDIAQIKWLEKLVNETAKQYGIVIFAHDAPLARLDYWSDEIRNENELMNILEECQRINKNILAYIHGHTHADYIYEDRLFPIISIGCAKCEDMQDKKPIGAYTPLRCLGTATQELWDTVIINAENKQLKFIRFGAGNDRTVRGRNI